MKAQKTLGELAAEKAAASLQPAEQPAPVVPKNNPAIDAKIDAFIADNPKLFDYYKNLSPERLVRACMLFRANEAEREDRRQTRQLVEMKQWAEQNPQIKAAIFAKLDRLPDEQRTGAFINLVRRAQQQASRIEVPSIPKAPAESRGM